MNSWTKLFSSIVTSTIWQESLATKVVWITLLALKDKQGRVEGSIPGLAHLAGVSIADCRDAISTLMRKDPDSRSKEHEGRRIEEIDGGWIVLNHFKYRDEKSDYRREYNRQKQAEYRARKKKSVTISSEFRSRESRFVKASENGDIRQADEIAAEGIPEVL